MSMRKIEGLKINIPEEAILKFCKKWQVVELAFFGSVLRDDFTENSDVDILVVFTPSARRTLFDMVRMEEELKQILDRNVDLASRRGVEQSENHIRRRSILESAKVIYAA